jgi:hypothetical protein
VSDMEVGSKVVWRPDDELGVVTAANSEAIEVCWSNSGREWYSVYCGAYQFIELVESQSGSIETTLKV